jgi:hypothetical protein
MQLMIASNVEQADAALRIYDIEYTTSLRLVGHWRVFAPVLRQRRVVLAKS